MSLRFVLVFLGVLSATIELRAAEPAPASPNLELEWRLQFDDLGLQMAGWPQLLSRISGKRHDLAAQTYRPESLVLPTDRDPVDILARRTAAVLAAVKRLGPKADLSAAEKKLGELQARARAVAPADKDARFALFAELCRVRREIVLANPLLNFSDIVFCTRGGAPGHCCDQYFGWANQPGGRLCLLKNALGAAPELCDLLAETTVAEGRLKGQKLKGGAMLSPAIDFDAKTVAFAYAEAGVSASQREQDLWSPQRSFHVFKMNLDGAGLTQLTDGSWNDFDPCFLPNGRIAFISERRGGYGRCHGRPVPTYTLHSMDADGGNVVCLSYHETNEWNPSVAHDGMIVYTRWDYVDRGPEITHHPWVTSPDGRDPRALHGNYPQNSKRRPYMESHVRAIPGSPLYLATAAPHHGESQGSLVLLDFRVADDDVMSQVKRITPEILFPESEIDNSPPGQFATAWPLSEDFYLACYAPRSSGPRPKEYSRGVPMGVYLVDSFGNRELIWRDSKLRCWNPVPVRRQPAPPVVPDRWAVEQAERHQKAGESKTGGEAVVSVQNVYNSLNPWPKDTKIAALRVVQLFPKSTPNVNEPMVGRASQMLARGVLGTVPVEEDGSVHFVMPAGKAVYFQALDERGLAVQSMMSAAYVHPGERLMCQGCHEPRPGAPPAPKAYPLALRRTPSRLTSDVEGTWPLSFARLVQPVLDAKCATCHQQEREKNPAAKTPGLSRAVSTLSGQQRRDGPHLFGWSEAYAGLADRAWSPGGARSDPGRVGAAPSRLFSMLTKGHHDVQLTPEELHRFTVWIDCGSPFFGVYERVEEQAQGKLVPPAVE